MVVYQNRLLVLGGETSNNTLDFWDFHIELERWVEIPIQENNGPDYHQLYNHHVVVYRNIMYVYGGKVSSYKNELWAVNLAVMIQI